MLPSIWTLLILPPTSLVAPWAVLTQFAWAPEPWPRLGRNEEMTDTQTHVQRNWGHVVFYHYCYYHNLELHCFLLCTLHAKGLFSLWRSSLSAQPQAINILEKEATVASLCLTKHSMNTHTWTPEKIFHFSWVWPIWVTALPTLQQTEPSQDLKLSRHSLFKNVSSLVASLTQGFLLYTEQ